MRVSAASVGYCASCTKGSAVDERSRDALRQEKHYEMIQEIAAGNFELTRDFHLYVTQVVNAGNIENHVYVKIFTYTFSRIRQKSHVYVKSVGIESISIFHVEAVAVDQ